MLSAKWSTRQAVSVSPANDECVSENTCSNAVQYPSMHMIVLFKILVALAWVFMWLAEGLCHAACSCEGSYPFATAV